VDVCENLFLLDVPPENHVLLHEHMHALDWLSKTSTPSASGKNQLQAKWKKTAAVAYVSENTEPDVAMRQSPVSNECSNLGHALAFLSAGYGDFCILEYIFSKRALDNGVISPLLMQAQYAITYRGQTLLHVAACRGSPEIVKWLVLRCEKALLNVFFEDMDAAHLAFLSGFSYIGKFLLDKRCDPIDLCGRDYVWHTKESGFADVIGYAVEVENDRRIPLMEADIDQHLQLLRDDCAWDFVKYFVETTVTFTTSYCPVSFSENLPNRRLPRGGEISCEKVISRVFTTRLVTASD